MVLVNELTPTSTNMQWYNEPPAFLTTDGFIRVTTGAKTDFWRRTHYGFIRDDGHFYYKEITGDFIIETKIIGEYESLFDQAGLMVRQNEKTWLKCGIEFVDGVQQASVVVTRDYSDWSVVPLPQNPTFTWLRLKRHGEAIEVYYSLDGNNYTMLRMAYLTETETLQIGLMCASPQGDGFTVSFEDFNL